MPIVFHITATTARIPKFVQKTLAHSLLQDRGRVYGKRCLSTNS